MGLGDPDSTLVVRDAGYADLNFIASLHADELPHAFFVMLGNRFLRLYHRTFMNSPHAVALVGERGGLPVGFVVGSSHPAAHRRVLLRRHGVRLAIGGVAALAVRPRVAWTFARTRAVRYARALLRDTRPGLRQHEVAATASSGAATQITAVLAHVAVAPAARGSGVGAALVHGFRDRVMEHGAARIELVTLADERGAADFYTRLGWVSAGAGAAGDYRRFALDLT